MSRPPQKPFPPQVRTRCLSCGSTHVFAVVVETAEGKVWRLECIDCGWQAHEPQTEEGGGATAPTDVASV